MDGELFEAAAEGDLPKLQQLLVQNPLILHTSALASAENPLHIASLAGHVDFAREILKLKPEFAKELSQDGLSPMHMASASGYLEITREMLKVDRNLCRIEGRDKMTPVHYAAMKGKVSLLCEMLTACPECIEDVTVQRETALHIAVRYSQFKAMDYLVGFLREVKREDILNLKDENGNTVLHLATWKKQRQVIELLLGNETRDVLEVNAINHSSLTALDLLLIFPSESGDREIEEILRHSNGIRARDILVSLSSPLPPFNHNQTFGHNSCSQSSNLIEYFKFKRDRDSPSDARSALLVVAVLVATSTFQVGLNPPGGIWEEGNMAGSSIMGSKSAVNFTLFAFFNSVGFAVSLFMINILTTNFPLHLELQICMFAMIFTYDTAMSSIAPNSTKVAIIVFTSVLPSLVDVLVKCIRQFGARVRQTIGYVLQKLGRNV